MVNDSSPRKLLSDLSWQGPPGLGHGTGQLYPSVQQSFLASSTLLLFPCASPARIMNSDENRPLSADRSSSARRRSAAGWAHIEARDNLAQRSKTARKWAIRAEIILGIGIVLCAVGARFSDPDSEETGVGWLVWWFLSMAGYNLILCAVFVSEGQGLGRGHNR